MGQGFTAKRLADMAGVSVRTLHYYEELGLLRPMRDAKGWRRYGERDIAALRVILTLRSCGLTAGEIRPLLEAEEPDMLETLSFHRERLMAEHRRIETLLATTDMFIEGWKDMKNMTDEESFEMLKQHCIERFEEEYGAEARQRYGASAIEEANARMAAMSQQDRDTKEELEAAIKDVLRALAPAGVLSDPEAAELAAMHGRGYACTGAMPPARLRLMWP